MLTWNVSVLGTSSSAQPLPGSSAVAQREHELHRQQVKEPSSVLLSSSSDRTLLLGRRALYAKLARFRLFCMLCSCNKVGNFFL